MAASRTQVRLILRLLDQAFNQKSWHGPNLRGSLRGITSTQASWRPGKNRHSIRDLALHAAYWKYVVRRQLLGEKRGSFPLAGNNWFAHSETSTHSWKAELKLLEQTHHSLRAVVARMDDATLRQKPSRRSVTTLDLLLGVAAHDLYHAGQIQLIKRLHQRRSNR
jgi:uncharacterized damage-inducible protein DinB